MPEIENGATPTAEVPSPPADPTFNRDLLLLQIGAMHVHHGAACDRENALRVQVAELQAANAQLREQLANATAKPKAGVRR